MKKENSMENQENGKVTVKERKSIKELAATAAEHWRAPQTKIGKVVKTVIQIVGTGLTVIGGVVVGKAIMGAGDQDDENTDTEFIDIPPIEENESTEE